MSLCALLPLEAEVKGAITPLFLFILSHNENLQIHKNKHKLICTDHVQLVYCTFLTFIHLCFPLHFYLQHLKIKAPQSFISVTMQIFHHKCLQQILMLIPKCISTGIIITHMLILPFFMESPGGSIVIQSSAMVMERIPDQT